MKKQNHQAATYIAAQTVAVVAILAGVADIVLRLLGFESVIATDIKLNSVLMLFGVAVGFLVELVRKQEELSESFKELSKRSLIAQLRTSDQYIEPELKSLVGAHISSSVSIISDIVENKRFSVSNPEEFRSFYMKVLSEYIGTQLMATTIPTRKYFWSSSEINVAMQRFTSGGGKIVRVFFIDGGLSHATPENLAVINEQHTFGVRCFILDTGHIPHDLVRLFLVATPLNLSWEPHRGPQDKITGINVSASEPVCSGLRVVFDRLIKLPAAVEYKKELIPMNETQFHEFELKGWDQSTSAYNRYFTSLTNSLNEEIQSRINLRVSSRTLDVACGPGHLTAMLAEAGSGVIGIDFSESMINIAKEKYPDVDFRIGDAHDLKFPNDSFDSVIMNFGVLHLAWPQKAISEAFRVLTEGGKFLMTVWGDPTKSVGFEIILKAIDQEGGMTAVLPEGPPFFRYSDESTAEQALTSAGFASVSVDEVKREWTLPDEDALFRAFYEGTARTGGVLRSLKNENLNAVRESVKGEAARYSGDGVVKIPMSVKVILGTK